MVMETDTKSARHGAFEVIREKHDEIEAAGMLNKVYTSLCNDKHTPTILSWQKCESCRLSKTRSSVVFGSGSLNARLLVIGEAPGPQEDEKGVAFCGPTGSMARYVLYRIGIKPDDVYFTNVLSCIPRDTKESPFRAPSSEEIISCLPRLEYITNSIFPYRLGTILFGKPAYIAYLTLKDKKSHDSIATLSREVRMNEILGDNETVNAYVAYHPSYISRRNDKNLTQEWINGLIGYISKVYKDLKNA